MSKLNGFLQLRRGVWEHVRDGRMSVTVALAFIYICCEADTRTGIWKGSAKSLSGELGIPERTARDVLEKMEHGDYIRRFAVPGRHSCYPILVHKFEITQGEHNGEQLNALESKSPAELSYFPREQSVERNGERGVEHGAAQRRIENRKKKQEKKTDHPKNDDAGLSLISLREKAKAKLLQEHPEEATFLEAALQMIEVRAHNSNCKPRTENYYLIAYENLKTSESDWQVVKHLAESPQSTDNLSRVNALILKAEREAARTGRDFFECFRELRQNPHWHEEIAKGNSPRKVVELQPMEVSA